MYNCLFRMLPISQGNSGKTKLEIINKITLLISLLEYLSKHLKIKKKVLPI